mmetsp:Transcript_47397/g.112804  ORF Transcript_47397/g.112804 Transcript_47397/m.112804 type:complete len:208 (+) Transcript_47397:438-1061(+)
MHTARLEFSSGCRQIISSPTLGAPPSATSSSVSMMSAMACPLSLNSRNSCFFPGTDTLAISCESLIRETPPHSTSLYTHPSAGCDWQVTRCVPIPNVSIECPTVLSLTSDSSHTSLEATIVSRSAIPATVGPPATIARGVYLASTTRNMRRVSLESAARSPESSRIPTGSYPNSIMASAQARKLGTPDVDVSYVSTNARKLFGNAWQ